MEFTGEEKLLIRQCLGVIIHDGSYMWYGDEREQCCTICRGIDNFGIRTSNDLRLVQITLSEVIMRMAHLSFFADLEPTRIKLCELRKKLNKG